MSYANLPQSNRGLPLALRRSRNRHRYECAPRLPFAQIIDHVSQAATGDKGGIHDLAREILSRWKADQPLLQESQRALFVFEAWNLLVIGASLVGFNYIPPLVSSPWTFWAL